MITTFKDLFDKISKLEDHDFIVNEYYHQKTSLKIKDHEGNLSNVSGMIIKEDNIFEVTVDQYSFKCGEKHIMIGENGLEVFAKDLKVGDLVKTVKGWAKVEAVKDLAYTDKVYDITVDNESMLYSDAAGMIHHNTHTVTTTLASLGLTQGEEEMSYSDAVEIDRMMKEGKRPETKNWVLFSGRASAILLYEALFLNPTSLIVLDDIDSIFNDENAVNILKNALDSKKIRQVGWKTKQTYWPSMTKFTDDDGEEHTLDNYADQREYFKMQDVKGPKIPNQFNFCGKIIFITNNRLSKMESDDHLRAIISRASGKIDVTLSPEDTVSLVRQIIPNFELDGEAVPEKLQLEAFEAFEELAKTTQGYISIRSFVSLLRGATSGEPNWKELAAKYF